MSKDLFGVSFDLASLLGSAFLVQGLGFWVQGLGLRASRLRLRNTLYNLQPLFITS